MRTYDIAVRVFIYIMLSAVIAFLLSISYYFSQWSKCGHMSYSYI